MPRRRRFEIVDLPQHVIQRGNNRQSTFFRPGDFERYLDCLRESALQYHCEVHAYVLMTNHVHLLVTPRRPLAIAGMMQSIGRRYVRLVNQLRQRTGTLWEGRYRACLVDTEGYLLTCHRYIEENPVRAGLVSDPRAYPWSSFRHNAWSAPNPVLTPHPCYLDLADSVERRCEVYRQMFEAAVDARLMDEIRQATVQCLPLGSDRFVQGMEAKLRRPLAPKKRGRPRLVERDLLDSDPDFWRIERQKKQL